MRPPGWRVPYVWVPLALALLAVPLGFAYVHWSRSGPGTGLYSRLWAPEPVQGYWDPDRFYQSVESVQGSFETVQCVACHEGITPGIVADWRASRHAAPESSEPVGCPDCHGADHQRLHLPGAEGMRRMSRKTARRIPGRGPLRLPQPCASDGPRRGCQALRGQAQGRGDGLRPVPLGGHQVRLLPYPPSVRCGRGAPPGGVHHLPFGTAPPGRRHLLRLGAREAVPLDRLWPRARIGFFEGQASAFYNVSAIERDYFEMWYFDSLGSYKAAAHNDPEGVERGHAALAGALAAVRARAGELRALGEAEQGRDGHRADPGELWIVGPYTEHNREHT